jgi:hypothetical protein
MKFNLKNMLRASLPLIGIGVVLVVISLVLQVVSLLLVGPRDITTALPVLGITSIPELASTVASYLMYPAFLILYFWGGRRGVKHYRLDTMGSAVSVAFAYLVTGLLNLVLGLVLSLLVLTNILQTMRYGSVESTLAIAFFGETAGAMGVALIGLCGVGILAIGTLINFVVGGVGAITAQR